MIKINLTLDVNINIFKEIILSKVFLCENEDLYLFEKNKHNYETLTSFLDLITEKSSSFSSYVLFEISFISNNNSLPSFYVFNLLYFLACFFDNKEKISEIYKLINLKKDIFNNTFSSKTSSFFVLLNEVNNTALIKNLNLIEKSIEEINSFYQKKKEFYTENILKDYSIKNTITEKVKIFFEISEKRKITDNFQYNHISEIFKDFCLCNKFPFIVYCIDEIDEYNLRKDFEPYNLQDIKNKFLRPFLFSGKSNSDIISYKSLSKYEKIFYRKKHLFYVNEKLFEDNDSSVLITSIPSKNEILNLEKNQLLISFIKNDSIIKLELFISKQNKLQGFLNDNSENILEEIFNIFSRDEKYFINKYYSINNIISKEIFIKGKIDFQKENLIENITDSNFNYFINLYNPISENKLIFTNETFIPYFKRKNPSKFFISDLISLLEEEENNKFNTTNLLNTISLKTKKQNTVTISSESYKDSFIQSNYLKSYKESVKKNRIEQNEIFFDNEEEEDIDEDQSENTLEKKISFNNISFKGTEIDISNEISFFKNFIKFISKSSYIEFVTFDVSTLEILKYNLSKIISLFYCFKKSNESYMKIQKLISDEKSTIIKNDQDELSSSSLKEQSFKTNFKKLFNIKNYAFEEIIKKREEISSYSNYCQCNFQPILLNNKEEAEDWLKNYENNKSPQITELNNKFFVCRDPNLIATSNKESKFLCCKKKDKSSNTFSISDKEEHINNNIEKEIIKKNISSQISKGNFGEISDELKDFFREIFYDKKKELIFLRKGTGESSLNKLLGTNVNENDDISDIEKEIQKNIFVFVSNGVENEYETTDPSPFFPLKRRDKDDDKDTRTTIYPFTYILFLVNGKYDFLYISSAKELYYSFDEEAFSKLEFIFKDYSKKIIIPSSSVVPSSFKEEGKKNKQEINSSFILTEKQYSQLNVQIFMYANIVKKMSPTANLDVIYSNNRYEIENFLVNNFLEHSFLIFEFQKNNFSYFPIYSKYTLDLKYKNDFEVLYEHFFEENNNDYYEKIFFQNNSEILNVLSKKIIIKIPISMENFYNFNAKGSSFSFPLINCLKDFEKTKNQLIFKGHKLVKNNHVFTSDNPNFIFLSAYYHRYNLYFGDINYEKNENYFDVDLYRDEYLVLMCNKNLIKIKNPKDIFKEEGLVKYYEIYEFEEDFRNIKKIFENIDNTVILNKKQNLLYAPFNNAKPSFTNSNDKFVDFYIKKNKLFFIPFEFVYIH